MKMTPIEAIQLRDEIRMGEKMKILVNQNEQKFGPLLPEELRELVYKGDVKRTALARGDGEPEWVSVDTLLTRPESRPAVRVPPKVAIPLEQLRDPKERKALTWLWVASAPAWLVLGAWTIGGLGIPLILIGAVV